MLIDDLSNLKHFSFKQLDNKSRTGDLFFTLLYCAFCREKDITGDWTANASRYFKMNLEQNITR